MMFNWKADVLNHYRLISESTLMAFHKSSLAKWVNCEMVECLVELNSNQRYFSVHSQGNYKWK